MSGLLNTDPDQVREHQKAIKELAKRAHTATEAAGIALNSNAFGIFGQFLAMHVIATGELAKGVLGGTALTLDAVDGGLGLTAEGYELVENVNEKLFGEGGR
ncbi:hypothetical protein GCM10012275_52240 [Longimycelium tulufanense]|uniref:Uncharacterized protein n=1 Tax=Longimycelium tulufanense TaxID=907463 RepID=A0A8J3CCT1_9PSEU|nr:hypothetical protein GCM10012275_52240 [Longimycelium tulufanense]